MPDAPAGRLTTHVLDIALGRPAAAIAIELRRAGEPALLARAITNADGRTDAPLLQGDALEPGEYELTFYVGPYLDAQHGPSPAPPFLRTIPVHFGIADAEQQHHVPLLLAPHGYSTYRGS